jgi:signal transduction histidine kinase
VPAAERRSPALLAAAVLATPALGVLALWITPSPGRALLLNAINAIAAAVAAVLALGRARRVPREARGWRWAAAAVTAQCVYQLHAVVYGVVRGTPPPFPGDIEALQILALACAGVALVTFAQRALPPRQRLRMALDGLIVGTAVFVVMWIAALGPFMGVATTTPGDRALVISDLAIIAADLGIAAYLGGLSPAGLAGPLGWILAALFAATAGNTAVTIYALKQHYFTGHPEDLLVLLALACFAMAAASREPMVPDPATTSPKADAGILIPNALVLAALAASAWLLAHPSPEGDPKLAVLVALTGAVVLARQQLALRDVELLSVQLEGAVLERTRDLAQSRAALEQMQRLEAIGRMAGGVAEDFRRLIVAMDRPVAALGAAVPPGHPDAEAVTEIRAAAHRALALTDQLLTFARRQHVEPRVVDVNALLAESVPLLRQLAGKAVTVDLRLTPEAAPVFADPTQLVQLLSNLAVNGRDAMPEGGTLAITTTLRSALPDGSGRRSVHVEVADTGAGMDDDTMGHIFEPFYTTKPAGKGTGLGLATCYGIVSRAGGSITVTSAPGRGTVFSIDLPLATGV